MILWLLSQECVSAKLRNEREREFSFPYKKRIQLTWDVEYLGWGRRTHYIGRQVFGFVEMCVKCVFVIDCASMFRCDEARILTAICVGCW